MGITAERVKLNHSILWLNGEDLSRYLNKIESVGLRICLYYHYLNKKVTS